MQRLDQKPAATRALLAAAAGERVTTRRVPTTTRLAGPAPGLPSARTYADFTSDCAKCLREQARTALSPPSPAPHLAPTAAHQALGKAMAPQLSVLAPCTTTLIMTPLMRHRTVALVGDSLSRQQFLSLLCLLAPRPRLLPPNHTHPVNAASGGREGGQGVAVVDVGWRFNLTWGAPVRGTARGAAVWLPGSNTTLLQRTSTLLCRDEALPAAVPVEEEGEEEEEEGEDEKKEGGSKGESVEEGREEGGQGRRQVRAGRRRQYRRVVQVYEADEWLLQHLWRLDVIVLSTANHWTAHSFSANQRAVQASPTARPFVPSESQLESTPFMAGLRRQALLAVMSSLALAAARSARAAPPLIFLRSASPSHFTGGTFQSGGRCDMHAPSIPWLRLLDAFPLSLMRPDAHVVAFPPLPKAPPLPLSFMSEKPLLPHRQLLPHEAVNGSLVGQGGDGSARGRVGGMTRDCVHWCLPGVPDTWNELMYADLLQSGLLQVT
ncbi:unnamed protein product [Closterium sp. Naga37s-1]|nr:unnamed protein product [Closterium sp. Naga37s-1]